MNGAQGPAGGEYALLTDLYQLTMLQAYIVEDMHGTAVFDLFARRLPQSRNYLVACGLQDALEYLVTLGFEPQALAYLDTLGLFRQAFLDYLANFRFSGEVRAVPEGTVVFADEPLLEVIAPLPEAQIIETFVLNQVHFQTLVASKAARVVSAAGDRKVVDFGLRRYHGIDAGLKAARAAWVAGVDATSNVLAGQRYGIPVSGTMAHSYILAHGSEREAFERFAGLYPRTVLLVDTYDTLEGVRKVVDLARSLGADFQVQAIRLDSGDLLELSIAARQKLDEGGLQRVGIFASGDLDEHSIGELLGNGAPIDGFGVGTHMGTSADAPFLNSAYKLVAYGGESRMKLSSAKATLPGRKQVYRQRVEGEMVRDVIALHDEALAGEPLLMPVMREGKLLHPPPSLSTLRETCRRSIASLPVRLRDAAPAKPPYSVGISMGIEREKQETINRIKKII